MTDNAKRCIARIRELDARATAGPWVKVCHGQASRPDWWSVNRGVYTPRVLTALPSQVVRCMSMAHGDADAHFISAARTDLPRFVDALEAAVEALRQVEANTRMKGRLAVNAYVQDALARIDRILELDARATHERAGQ